MSRSRRPSKQTKGRGARPTVARDFWGDPESVPDVVTTVRPADDASTLVRSLGAPPLTGHEVIAEHYFRAVFDKASNLAVALAATSGLLDDGADDEFE